MSGGTPSFAGRGEASGWDAPPYETNRVIRIPTAVPELGVESGDGGVIDIAYRGRSGNLVLLVEVPKDGGTSAGLLDVEVLPGGSLRVLNHTVLDWPPGEAAGGA